MRAREQAELDGAEAILAVDGERAELDERAPELRPLVGPASWARSAPGHSRRRSVSIDSASQVCSSVSSRSIAYSWGSARMRSAMMLRWICCVPPYTLAAREYR